MDRIWQNSTDISVICTDMFMPEQECKTCTYHVCTCLYHVRTNMQMYIRVCTFMEIPVLVMYIDSNLHIYMYMVWLQEPDKGMVLVRVRTI